MARPKLLAEGLRRWAARLGAGQPSPGGPSATTREGDVIAVSVLGLRGTELEAILESVLTMTRGAGVRPVFVTDLLDLRGFHRHRLAVEPLPFPRGSTRSDGARWRLYRDRECRRIARVWAPRAVLEYGRPLEPGQRALLASALPVAKT
jgi:hypothetical protein